MGINYLYPCKGVTRTGKVIQSTVIAPNATAARRNFKGGFFGDKKPVSAIKIGKRRGI